MKRAAASAAPAAPPAKLTRPAEAGEAFRGSFKGAAASPDQPQIKPSSPLPPPPPVPPPVPPQQPPPQQQLVPPLRLSPADFVESLALDVARQRKSIARHQKALDAQEAWLAEARRLSGGMAEAERRAQRTATEAIDAARNKDDLRAASQRARAKADDAAGAAAGAEAAHEEGTRLAAQAASAARQAATDAQVAGAAFDAFMQLK